jgi:hypothetical protein
MVVQDPDSGQSLIAVFHEIKIRIGDTSEVPSNALIPKDWTVFTKFALEPEEEGKDYVLNTRIFWPDGSPFVDQSLTANQPTKNALVFTIRMQGFPIGQSGMIKIRQTLTSGGIEVCEQIEVEVRVVLEKALASEMATSQ